MSFTVEKAMLERSMMEKMMLTSQQKLTEYCDQCRPGIRRVQQLLDSLHTEWGNLMIRHVSYLSEKGLEMASDESKTYLKKQRGIYLPAKLKAEDLIEGLEFSNGESLDTGEGVFEELEDEKT